MSETNQSSGKRKDSFESLEQQVGEQMARYFSDDVLSYTRQITNAIKESESGWVPIQLFTPRLSTKDEAVVASGVRGFATGLEISEDGKYVRRRDPIPTYAEMDQRTVYVERLAPRSTEKNIADYFASFGLIEKILLSDPGPRQKSQHAGYAFVVFERKEDAIEAAQTVGSKFRKLTTLTDVKAFVNEEIEDSGLGEVRVMLKTKWSELTEEYAQLQAKRREELSGVVRSQFGYQRAEYQPKVVARFCNVFRGTTPRVLKRLFEMIAPVTYVDLERNQTKGHVRFKTAQGARLAFVFFASEYVVQKHKDDAGTLLQRQSKKAKKAKVEQAIKEINEWADWEEEEEVINNHGVMAEERPGWPNIGLELLTGDEEQAYWDLIAQLQEQKEWKQANAPHETRGQEAEAAQDQTSAGIGRTHVKFDDSDSEGEAESEQPTSRASGEKEEQACGKRHTKFTDSDEGEQDNSDDTTDVRKEKTPPKPGKRKRAKEEIDQDADEESPQVLEEETQPAPGKRKRVKDGEEGRTKRAKKSSTGKQ